MGYQRQEVQAASYEYIPIGMGYQRNGLPAAVGELSGQCIETIEWLTTQLKRKLRLAPPTDCKPAVVHASRFRSSIKDVAMATIASGFGRVALAAGFGCRFMSVYGNSMMMDGELVREVVAHLLLVINRVLLCPSLQWG